ncbi:MAG TPA: DUF1501 domain-containing protein [Bauldia sp.]|nr:DUF1501 domain-containing protein [Bauldia sp.]
MTPPTECIEGGLSRRSFMKASAILTLAGLPDLAWSAEVNDRRLVIVLLRGGMDGLFSMPPVGDKNLNSRRRHLVTDGLLKLDGFFTLHPALKTLHQLYQDNQALLVHGISVPYTGRSHFEGQDIMQTGLLTPYASKSGWAGRALEVAGYGSVTMSLPVPLVLRGENFAESRYPTWMVQPPPELYSKLVPLWAADDVIAPFGDQIRDEILHPTNTMAITKTSEGETALSTLARDAASRLVTADGPRVAVLDYVGFDTHSQEDSQQASKLRGLDTAIATLQKGMRDRWKDTLVVTVTEFGRTIAENGSWGTDHGWGSAIFVTGGLLKKAGVVADWPGLATKNLYEGRDLKATIDARSLYAKIISSVFQIDPEMVKQKVIDAPKDDRFDAYI